MRAGAHYPSCSLSLHTSFVLQLGHVLAPTRYLTFWMSARCPVDTAACPLFSPALYRNRSGPGAYNNNNNVNKRNPAALALLLLGRFQVLNDTKVNYGLIFSHLTEKLLLALQNWKPLLLCVWDCFDELTFVCACPSVLWILISLVPECDENDELWVLDTLGKSRYESQGCCVVCCTNRCHTLPTSDQLY